MNIKNIFVILSGLYLTIWHAGFSNLTSIKNSHFNYTVEGISLGLITIIAGLGLFTSPKISKLLVIICVLANIAVTVGFALLPEVWMYLLVSILQGCLLAQILLIYRNIPQKSNGLLYFSIVVLVGYIPSLIGNELTSNSLQLQYVFSGLMVALLLINLILILIKPATFFLFENKTEHITYHQTKKNSLEALIFTLLCIVEILFFIWMIILTDRSQHFINSLYIPLTCIFLIILRLFIKKLPEKYMNKGWLFAMTLLATISSGFFFTMGTKALFILCFPLAMVVGQQIALVLNKNTKPLFTVRLLFIFALAMVISSLYIDNHMDYIRALKMPEKLLNLSAFQAYVKEITSLTGVAVVLSGILYLRKSE